jgi:5-methylthioribose kinase
MAVEAEQGFCPLDEATLVAYIKATPALASLFGSGLNSITVQEVSNGNLNFIYIVLSHSSSSHRRPSPLLVVGAGSEAGTWPPDLRPTHGGPPEA